MNFDFQIFVEFTLSFFISGAVAYSAYWWPKLRNKREFTKTFRKLVQNQWLESLENVVDRVEEGIDQDIGHYHDRHEFWFEHQEKFLELYGAEFYLEVEELFLRFNEMKKLNSETKKKRFLFIEQKMQELVSHLEQVEETPIELQLIPFLRLPRGKFSFIDEFHDGDFTFIPEPESEENFQKKMYQELEKIRECLENK